MQGKITVLRTGHPFPVGGSAFAQIKISNTAKKKRADAELVLKAQTADILKVSGGRVQVRNSGGEHIARLTRITKGKPRIVVVELKLREAGRRYRCEHREYIAGYPARTRRNRRYDHAGLAGHRLRRRILFGNRKGA